MQSAKPWIASLAIFWNTLAVKQKQQTTKKALRNEGFSVCILIKLDLFVVWPLWLGVKLIKPAIGILPISKRRN
jgi:hypothetical protein